MNKSVFEGIKEAGRVAIFAVVSYLLTEGVVGQLLEVIKITIDPAMKLVIIGLITSILRAVDKWGHEEDNKVQLPF